MNMINFYSIVSVFLCYFSIFFILIFVAISSKISLRFCTTATKALPVPKMTNNLNDNNNNNNNNQTDNESRRRRRRITSPVGGRWQIASKATLMALVIATVIVATECSLSDYYQMAIPTAKRVGLAKQQTNLILDTY